VRTGGSGDPVRRVRIRWGGGGVAVGVIGGFVAGLSFAGNLTWVGVGAVATVAGVAVAATNVALQESDRRYSRRQHEDDRVAREAARRRDIAQERERIVAEADAVDVVGLGGGGRTDDGFVHCQQVTFLLTNGAAQPISKILVELDPLVELIGVQSGEYPTSLAAGSSSRWTVVTEEYVIPQDEASSREMRTRVAVATFVLEGRTWSKRRGAAATLVEGTLPTAD